MNKKVIASELLKIAKDIMADAGDISIYYNVYNLLEFDTTDPTTEKTIRDAVSTLIYRKLYWPWERELKAELKKLFSTNKSFDKYKISVR